MKYTLILCFLFAFQIANSQDSTVIALIKTSAQCESCKNRLETRMIKLIGVVSVNLNMNTKDLNVVYDPNLTSLEELEEKINFIGYDANGKPAKKAAYKRLPACCRKDYKGTHH